MNDRTVAPLEQDLVSRLRLKDLQFVLRVAELRSLSAAASELHLTQPAASRWLRDIEQLFQAHLFMRDRMVGMTPTALGDLVVARARALLADVSSLSQEVEAHRAGRGGHLRLGVIPYVSANLLQNLVTILLDEHAMTASVLEAATEPLLESLRLQRLHAVIGRCSVQPPGAALRQEVLFSQKACLLVHADSTLRRSRDPKLADLSGFRWILPPKESPTARAILASCNAARQAPPRAVLETASTKLVHALVEKHADMVAILPLDVGTDLERLGGVRVLPFPGSFRMPPVGMVAHARHWNQSHVGALRKALRTLVATGGVL